MESFKEKQAGDFLLPRQITQRDIHVLDDLLERTEFLPDILHLRAADTDYVFTQKDRELLFDTYSKLDDILKEVAAFINIKFPGCQRHVYAWNKIDFDTKIGDIKIITNDREHISREWKRGLFDLKSLIKVLTNEAKLLLSEDSVNQHSGVLEVPENNFNGSIVYNKKAELASPNTFNSHSRMISRQNIRSWLEILSWIAGIVGTALAAYAMFR